MFIGVDPLFFYVPTVAAEQQCLSFDRESRITAIVLHSIFAIVYLRYVNYKHFWRFSLIDLLVVLPLPLAFGQEPGKVLPGSLNIEKMAGIILLEKQGYPIFFDPMKYFKILLCIRYLARIISIYSLFSKAVRSSTELSEAKWVKIAVNLYLYLQAANVFGGLWYFMAIERVTECWTKACINHTGQHCHFSCRVNLEEDRTYINGFCPTKIRNTTIHDFGIFHGALESGIVEGTSILQKLLHCFVWGLQNLSNLGHDLQSGSDVWENIFVILVVSSGFLFFALLIGNMQIYLQSRTVRLKEMTVKPREIEEWKPFQNLSANLQQEMKKYKPYIRRKTNHIDIENLLNNIPKELGKKIKRELCWHLLKKMAGTLLIETMGAPKFVDSVRSFKHVVFIQYVARIIRIYALFSTAMRSLRKHATATWARFAFNLFVYLQAANVFGGLWYFMAIERQTECWTKACINYTGRSHCSFNCHDNLEDYTFLNEFCPMKTRNATIHDFGIFHGALESGILEGKNFLQKILHCFIWGLQNLSNLGHNLQTSGNVEENIFVILVVSSGFLLFALLIGNMQRYLKLGKEMTLKPREIEEWQPFQKLSKNLQQKVKKYKSYIRRKTDYIDVQNLLNNLPNELRRELKRELCWNLLKKVQGFRKLNEVTLDALCDCVKPTFFTEHTHLIREGDPIDEMIFVVQGKLRTYTFKDIQSGSTSSDHKRYDGKNTRKEDLLQDGDFYGEELIDWALRDRFSFDIPKSNRTIQALTNVDAFMLMADDLKIINFAKLSQAMGFQRSPSSKQKVKPISKENNDENGGDHSINERTTSNPPDSVTSDASYNSWMMEHPSALGSFDKMMKAAKEKKIAVFLNYDGTLSPIVDDPDRVFMSDEMRAAVREVAKYFPTAIISGRSREKVMGFVELCNVYYAGSHGMDILAPPRPVKACEGKYHTLVPGKKGNEVLFQPAKKFLPAIQEIIKELEEETKKIQGARIEDNRFCISVHFRQVREEDYSILQEKAKAVLRNYPDFDLSEGKKVMEIRPSIEWDKGHALEYLLDTLGLSNPNDVLPLYIGDDRTDEDAFKVIKGRGQGYPIIVSSTPKETKASYSLNDPSEVLTFLLRLVKMEKIPLLMYQAGSNLGHTKFASSIILIMSQDLRLEEGANPVSGHFQGGLQSGVEIKKLAQSCNHFLAKCFLLLKKIHDPQRPYGYWVFLISCVMIISVDPVFFYVPTIAAERKCLGFDGELRITAIALHSISAIVYLTYVNYLLPTASPKIEVKHFWHFSLIDLLVVLPLPLVLLILIIDIPELGVQNFMFPMNFFLLQYLLRVTRCYTLFTKATRVSGILAEAKWAKAAFNFLLYLNGGHVFGALWYFSAVAREMICWEHACSVSTTGCSRRSFYCSHENSIDNQWFFSFWSKPATKCLSRGKYLRNFHNHLLHGALCPFYRKYGG
ncbi:hypothetical protein CUMW_090210 [Citrus unshiu]|nr:hypothetical protein CUMW_090210 [Citrus unshiu]